MKPLTMHTGKLTDDQASALQAALVARDWKPRTVPYARFAFESDKCNVVFYESGKLVVQGKGVQEFVEFLLEPEILKQAKLGYETVLNPDLLLPRFGVDESGKGDFFGPMCIAGVYVNEAVINAWKKLPSWPRKSAIRPVAWRIPSWWATRPTTGFTRR
jgi:ribonuclease HIII